MRFVIDKHIEIEAEYYETRYSWGHKAWLYLDGRVIADKKITYYNRTWERYQFESILYAVVEKAKQLTDKQVKKCNDYIKNYDEPSRFSHITAVMAMGDILTDNQKDANDWKTRMLKAGLGEAVSMPEDWDTLSEEEKQRRLDGAMAILS